MIISGILSTVSSAFEALLALAKWVWDKIFGSWSYGVIFSWLPSDIRHAVDFLILFLFALVVFKVISRILSMIF